MLEFGSCQQHSAVKFLLSFFLRHVLIHLHDIASIYHHSSRIMTLAMNMMKAALPELNYHHRASLPVNNPERLHFCLTETH